MNAFFPQVERQADVTKMTVIIVGCPTHGRVYLESLFSRLRWFLLHTFLSGKNTPAKNVEISTVLAVERALFIYYQLQRENSKLTVCQNLLSTFLFTIRNEPKLTNAHQAFVHRECKSQSYHQNSFSYPTIIVSVMSSPKSTSKQTQVTLSTVELSTTSTAPFHLYTTNLDDSLSPRSQQHHGEYVGPSRMQFRTTDDSDAFSVTSHVSFQSVTDGVDILSGRNTDQDATGLAHFLLWLKYRSGRVVSSVLFKRTVLSLILFATLLLALRTMDPTPEYIVEWINIVLVLLLWIFTLEVVVQICFYQGEAVVVGWLVADTVILVVAWSTRDETCLALRGFRLLRALRKANGIPSLQWAVKALLRVLPRVLAVIMVLLPGMFAIFTILFTNLYQEASSNSQSYFDSLKVTAMTLFQIMTYGLEWGVIEAELRYEYPLSWIPLVLYVVVAKFIFGGLMIAVMCDAVSTMNQERLSKSLDQRVAPSRSNDGPLLYQSGRQSELNELHMLERKLDILVASVDRLLQMHGSIQKEVNVLTQQQQQMLQNKSNE